MKTCFLSKSTRLMEIVLDVPFRIAALRNTEATNTRQQKIRVGPQRGIRILNHGSPLLGRLANVQKVRMPTAAPDRSEIGQTHGNTCRCRCRSKRRPITYV